MLTYLYYSTYAYAKIAAIRALVARMQWGVLAERHHLSGQGQGFAGRSTMMLRGGTDVELLYHYASCIRGTRQPRRGSTPLTCSIPLS